MAVAFEEALCCLTSKAKWTSGDKELAQAYVRELNSNAFWDLAVFNGVAILAAKKLAPLGVTIPEHVKREVALIETQNRERRERALGLFDVLQKESIRVFLLKGFLFGETVYHDYAYKRMNDVDILIQKDEVQDAVLVAKEHGFAFAVESMLGKSSLDFRLHHSPPLLSADRKLILGLHWGLASPFSKRKPRSSIFCGQHPVVVDGVRMWSLSDETNVLHLCMHLPFFKIGLRELCDVSNLMNDAGERICFESLVSKANEWRMFDSLYRVLRLADSAIAFMSDADKAMLEEESRTLSRSRYLTDTQARLKNIKILLRSRSTYIGKVEKNYALFKLATRFRDRCFHLKEQWRLILWVPLEERKRLLVGAGWFSHFRATGALCFAMAQDLGVKLLVAVTIKNILSLFTPSRRNEVDFKAAKELLERME